MSVKTFPILYQNHFMRSVGTTECLSLVPNVIVWNRSPRGDMLSKKQVRPARRADKLGDSLLNGEV